MGFRPNESTADIIFIVRRIYEKCYEYNIDLHSIFIDISYAYDTVNRDLIYNSLIKYNFPDKLIKLTNSQCNEPKWMWIKCNIPDTLIKLIKLAIQRNKMKVNITDIYTDWFETKQKLDKETCYPPHYLVQS
jgi:hypothetical protein